MNRWKSMFWAAGCILLISFGSSPLGAQQEEKAATWQPATLGQAIYSTLIFGFIGIVLGIAGFKLFDLVIPFKLEQEICEKQNIAVAILSAAMVLGICIIVAAAVI